MCKERPENAVGQDRKRSSVALEEEATSARQFNADGVQSEPATKLVRQVSATDSTATEEPPVSRSSKDSIFEGDAGSSKTSHTTNEEQGSDKFSA